MATDAVSFEPSRILLFSRITLDINVATKQLEFVSLQTKRHNVCCVRQFTSCKAVPNYWEPGKHSALHMPPHSKCKQDGRVQERVNRDHY